MKKRLQGMNWIRQEKRLAIYLRDGLACCYCGRGVEEEVKLSLDHITPYSEGGSNDPSNLVTCCMDCNRARRTRPMKAFVQAVADYHNHGLTPSRILSHITACRRRALDLTEAKALIARRGGLPACLTAQK